MRACTLQATKYTLTLSGEPLNDAVSLNIWDTVGLEEPNKDPLKAIENAYALITDLHRAGGVDLLLFCIRGGRITEPMQRHYRLFFEFLCDRRVPLAIVVTHLENEEIMENWWVRNAATVTEYGMCSIAHACITAVPAHLAAYDTKRWESQTTLRDMLRKTLKGIRPVYVQDVRAWFMRVVEMVLEFLMGGSFKKRALAKRLQTRCGFRPGDAERIAEMMLAARRG